MIKSLFLEFRLFYSIRLFASFIILLKQRTKEFGCKYFEVEEV